MGFVYGVDRVADNNDWLWHERSRRRPIPSIPDPMETKGSSGPGGGATVPNDDPTNYTPSPSGTFVGQNSDPMTTIGGPGSAGSSSTGSSGGYSGSSGGGGSVVDE